MPKSIFILIVGLYLLLVSSVTAQPPAKPPDVVTDKPRKQKAEKSNALINWAKEDVPYIITPEERRAYEALKTDEERENFIRIFWDNRDPNPDTAENEFREEYYQRISYANENFTSGIPGWKTDRGRIYIRWGKPDSVESHPAGGSYNDPNYRTGDAITTYPFEIWFYRNLDGPGSGVEIEFVDPTGTGEYRLARGPDDKNVLATVTGPRTDPLFRRQETPLDRSLLYSQLEMPPRVKFTALEGIASGGSGVIDSNPLEFDLRVDVFRQSETSVIAAFSIQAPNDELSFTASDGLQTATLNIFGRVTAVSNRRSGIFEDSVSTNATPGALAELKAGSSIYQKLIALSPGIYKVDVVVRDVVSGSTGIRTVSFTVPRYDNAKLSTSTLVLSSSLRSTTAADVGAMFVIGKNKVVPNVSGRFRKGQDVGVYLQVYNAGIDQTTLRPAIDVEYILMRDGKEVSRTREDWTGLSDSGQRLTLARLFPTRDLDVGEYHIKIVIKDRVTGQTLNDQKLSAVFTLTQ